MSAGVKLMQTSLAAALEDLHARIAQAILALDKAAWHWQPAPGLPSVYDLVVRVAAEERHWIVEAFADLPALENGVNASPEMAGLEDHPLFVLGSTGQLSQTILAMLPPADWSALRQVGGRTVVVAGCILHVLEELARTLGQIEVVAGLWEVETVRRKT
jgi:hypothetical protein